MPSPGRIRYPYRTLSGQENTEIRFAVDGACHLYQTIPYHYKAAMVPGSRSCRIWTSPSAGKPQDGKIKFKKFGPLDIELRVATIPTRGGMEDVVMRILAAGEPIPLEKMGMSESNFKDFARR